MNMQDRITATREQVRRRLYDARETGKKALNEAEESISKHPIGSVAAAVGVGFLIAKLMDMRTHR